MLLSRKALAIGAAAVSTALIVSACGSKKASVTTTGSPSTSTTSSGSTAAGTPIKVGVMCACTGAFGTTVGAGYTVLQAWAKSVNAAGGLNGHPVDLIEKDNGSVPGTAATDAQALISDHVSVIIDEDILEAVWEQAVDAAHIPVIGGSIASQPYVTDPNFYASGETNDSVIYGTLATAKTAGATNIGLIYCAESPSCASSVPEEKTVAAQLGVPVVYTSSIAATAPNFTAQCLAAKQAGATALFLADGSAETERVAQDCTQQGYSPIYITEGTGYQDSVLTTPGMKDKLWLSFPILPYFSTNSAVTAMNTALDTYAPGLRKNALTWSEFGAEAWTGGQLLQLAIKNANPAASSTVTSAEITSGLNMVSGNTLGGFSPSLTFTAGKAHTTDCWFTARVQGGVPSVVGSQICHTQ